MLHLKPKYHALRQYWRDLTDDFLLVGVYVNYANPKDSLYRICIVCRQHYPCLDYRPAYDRRSLAVPVSQQILDNAPYQQSMSKCTR